MLANFFSKSKPVTFIVLFFLFLSYFFSTVFLKDLSFIAATKELFLFMVVFSVYNFIILKNDVTSDNSFAFLFYVILIGFFIKNIQIDTLFYANVTTFLFLRKVYSLQTKKNIVQKLFDGAIWLGISFILEPFTLVFISLFYITLYLNNKLTYQTLLIPIFGFVAPVFLYFTFCFWYDIEFVFFQNNFDWTSYLNFDFYLNDSYFFSLIFIGVFTLIAVLLKTPSTLSILNRFRRKWILILSHLFLAGIIFVLIPNKTGNESLFLLFPSSIVLANGIEIFERKWLVNTVIIVFWLASIVAFFL